MGDVKYPNVAIIFKAVLSRLRGNADLEEGFSLSSNFLMQDKASMSGKTLNAAMTVKSAMKMFHMQPDLVPITRELVALACVAHASYNAHLQQKKMHRKKLNWRRKIMAENGKHKMKLIASAENKLKVLQSEQKQKRKTADALFEEANKRLKEALEKCKTWEKLVWHMLVGR
ncbi:hypothetical protein PR048_009455, partial [Dryococelus australis]